MKFGKSIRELWTLDDNVTYLNHGSYGATPLEIIKAAEKIQRELEREPVSFFADKFFDLLRYNAAELASFIGTTQGNIALLENATAAVNTVLRSILPSLRNKDEIIINNHTYPAVKMACKYIADVSGCTIKEITLPYPQNSYDEWIDLYAHSINKSTKLIIIDHILYTTGAIAPVKEIAEIAREKNVPVLVDGAHVPGMIELNIDSLGVDWYTGNCHKWLFAPKGAAFLYTAPAQQNKTHPLSISYYYGESYTKEFDWTGTHNPASQLVISKAIDFHRRLGSTDIYNYMHKLVVEGRKKIADELNYDITIPDNMSGALAAIELYDIKPKKKDYVNELRKHFFKKYNIEVAFTEFDGRILLRLSAQIYNEISDYNKLTKALKDFLPKL